jgi:hypothetical protein
MKNTGCYKLFSNFLMIMNFKLSGDLHCLKHNSKIKETVCMNWSVCVYLRVCENRAKRRTPELNRAELTTELRGLRTACSYSYSIPA